MLLKKTILFACIAISINTYSNGRIVIPYYQDGKYGFCDTLGKQITMMDYDKIQNLMYYFNPETKEHTCLFVFEKNKHIYVVNQDNKTVVPDNYDSVYLHYLYADRFIIQKNDRKGIYYNNKELIPCQYDYVRPTANNSFVVKNNNLFGLINEEGKLIIPVEYQKIKFTADDNSTIIWEAEGQLTEEEFYDKKVNYLVKYGYPDSSAKNKYGNVRPFSNNNEKISDGTETESNYVVEEIKVSGNGNGTGSYYRKEPKKPAKLIELETQYDKVIQYNLPNDLFYIQKGKLAGIYDTVKNKIMIPVEYDYLNLAKWTPRLNTFLFYAGQKGKYGIIDEQNKIKAPFEYSNFMKDKSSEDIFYLEKDGKVAVFIDETIYPLIPAKYENIVAAKSIRVSNNWSFQLFITGEKDHIKFIGENGMEYFK